MVDSVTPRYTGKRIEGDPDPYLPTPELVEAVNLTILLESRPLLIKGEPGSGKTRLAYAVAREFGVKPYVWSIKSTSRARDGFYRYDALERLQDVELKRLDDKGQPRADNIANYIHYGVIGKAFMDDIGSNGLRPVVLIDEIDKADIDFPNDLLLELDEQAFEVTETGERVEAKLKPIVFITSNDEKELPEAFLRRCLFIFIEFPSPQQLLKIVLAHAPKDTSHELASQIVKRFTSLREQMVPDRISGKLPSTSELLDWFNALHSLPDEEVRKKLAGDLIPFPEVLLKSWEHYKDYYLKVLQAQKAGEVEAPAPAPAPVPTAGT